MSEIAGMGKRCDVLARALREALVAYRKRYKGLYVVLKEDSGEMESLRIEKAAGGLFSVREPARIRRDAAGGLNGRPRN
jgi:hypothetical protein